MSKVYSNAEAAFEDLYDKINSEGVDFAGTKALFNVGFYIENPMLHAINTPWRKWNANYAKIEWQWYLSGDRSAVEIAKYAKIWYSCMDYKGEVNSNYGWHWQRNGQLKYVIEELKRNRESRRASITIYDAKDRYNFENDTPCTYAINFMIVDNKLNMSVMMRSNDLWYGFCNDQYCFSMLQLTVANELDLAIGTYYHFTNNMHVYNKFLNKNINIKNS